MIKPSQLFSPFPWIVLVFLLSSCTLPTSTPIPETTPLDPTAQSPTLQALIPPTTPPPRALTVCLGQEPTSLFIYADGSSAARSVRQAIFDGPAEIVNYELQPVILERLPNLANADVLLEPTQVVSGTLIVASDGSLATLEEGVVFLPAGCNRAECSQSYAGEAAVSMEQLVVRFRLRPGLLWADGVALTAADSVFSYEVARALYPRARPNLIDFTHSYLALDELTVEWRGLPGYKDPLYQTNFFVPLPQHLWGSIPPGELLSAEISSRMPLGWGPYMIEEWTSGDHITLIKNPNYYRASEGLPYFERLVYRFIGQGETALSALLAGECDFVDESGLDGIPHQRLFQLQDEGRIKVIAEPGTAWEHADFGLASLDAEKLSLFQSREVRQAIAQCIDRQALAESLFYGKPVSLNTFVPPTHPLYNNEARDYAYDPQAAASLLEAAGWVDADGNTGTPRIAQGVPGVPDGTPLVFSYQTLGGGERQGAAELIRDWLAQCGIAVNLQYLEREAFFAPGPDGPLFGRRFDMAQFAWPASLQPACFLYSTGEIPGPYPQFPKGWGGANDTGFSNLAFDRACQRARFSLPDSPDYAMAHREAQAVFAEELPAIPLYVHLTWAAMRVDLCGVELQEPVENTLWNLETWDYGPDAVCD